MPLVIADRVLETTTTTGTGTVTLAGAVTGYQSFGTAVGNGNTTYYTIAIDGGTDWEVGIGTYTASGTTLSRDTVLASSNSGSLVPFGSGTKNVFVTYPGGKAVYYQAAGGVVVTDSSSNDALRITQTGAGNALVVEDSANPDSTPFVVDANGKVVSGNTTAYSATSGIIPQIASVGNTNGTASMGIGRFSADVSQGYYVFTKSRSATLGTFGSIVSNGDAIGTLLWTADDGTSVPIQAASITVAVDGAPGTGDMPGRLVFSTTADGASTPTERMRIDNAGRVGIGGTPTSADTLRIGRTLGSAATSYGIINTGVVQSTVTTDAQYYNAVGSTAAAAFTLTNLRGYYYRQATIGATSAVTNQYGFFVESDVTGATNNYGFYSNIASGTGRWNFYANGTADNYFAGNVGITATPVASKGTLQVGTIGYTGSNILSAFSSSVNGYNQVISQNTNSGASASSDFIVSNNLSTDTTYYGDFGINSSGWAGSGPLTTANNVYLTSTTSDLAIGTTTANNILFATNGDNERFRIGSSGELGIGGANYGTSGQTLTSRGSAAAPVWSNPGIISALVFGL